VIGVMLAALIMASPEVRAQIAQRIESLFYGPVELIVVTQKLGPSSSEMRVSPVPNVPVERMSLEAAQAELAFKTPTWHPERLTAEATVTVIRWSEEEIGVGYRWMDENDGVGIVLSVMNNDKPRMVIGAGANSREIEINGQTGTIYNGSYDYRAWVAEGYLNVVWVMDGVTYHLGSATATEDELVRMAESVE
jgi:hypothetical protein